MQMSSKTTPRILLNILAYVAGLGFHRLLVRYVYFILLRHIL